MECGIFDVIGPVMHGPSSNHTAGAARIGYLAGKIMGGLPKEVTITFHPAFMEAFAGQRAHEALLAGCMGFREYELPDEGPWSELKRQGIAVNYESLAEPEGSRNYMGIAGTLQGVHWKIEGDSVGGGTIHILRINGTEPGSADRDLPGRGSSNGFYSGGEWLYLWGLRETDGVYWRRSERPLTEEEKQNIEASLPEITFRRELPPLDRFVCRGAEPSYPDSFENLLALAEETGDGLDEIALRCEADRTLHEKAELLAEARRLLAFMVSAREEGLKGRNHLLGGFCSGSDGKRLLDFSGKESQAEKSLLISSGKEQRTDMNSLTGGVLTEAMAGAMAIAERNAAGGLVVAAPTGGSAGTLPGVLLAAAERVHATEERQSRALLTAGLLGVIIGKKASFSGSTGGCQGEIGAGAAMAAGAAAFLANGTTDMIVQAAVLTMKNGLGLTCDCPVGVVEIPCIKRNAFGAAAALAAAELALSGIRSAVPPDEVLDAFAETQRLMPSELRGGCQRGLASGKTAERMREEWRGKNNEWR